MCDYCKDYFCRCPEKAGGGKKLPDETRSKSMEAGIDGKDGLDEMLADVIRVKPAIEEYNRAINKHKGYLEAAHREVRNQEKFLAKYRAKQDSLQAEYDKLRERLMSLGRHLVPRVALEAVIKEEETQ